MGCLKLVESDHTSLVIFHLQLNNHLPSAFAGIMIGLPGQTMADLANDLVFFRSVGADMIGEVYLVRSD